MYLATARQVFGFSHFVVTRNLEGLTHELSLLRPSGANCANWVLGHILSTRGLLHAMIGQDTPLTEAEAAPYRRGTKPAADTPWLPFEELAQRLALSQPRLFEGLESLGPEDWAVLHSAGPFQNRPLSEVAVGLGLHECYHAGQLGLLRQPLGLGGALA